MTNSDFINLHLCLAKIEAIALYTNENLNNQTLQVDDVFVDYNISFEGKIVINEITFSEKRQNDLINKLNEYYAEYFREY